MKCSKVSKQFEVDRHCSTSSEKNIINKLEKVFVSCVRQKDTTDSNIKKVKGPLSAILFDTVRF